MRFQPPMAASVYSRLFIGTRSNSTFTKCILQCLATFQDDRMTDGRAWDRAREQWWCTMIRWHALVLPCYGNVVVQRVSWSLGEFQAGEDVWVSRLGFVRLRCEKVRCYLFCTWRCKWRSLMSMCLRPFLFAALFSTLTALWFSMKILADLCDRGTFMSNNRRLKHNFCCNSMEAARYTASKVLNATFRCLDDVYKTGARNETWRVPVVDFRSCDSAKLASENVVSCRLEARVKWIPCVRVCFKYLSRFFKRSMCFVVVLLKCRTRRDAAYSISRWVLSAR